MLKIPVTGLTYPNACEEKTCYGTVDFVLARSTRRGQLPQEGPPRYALFIANDSKELPILLTLSMDIFFPHFAV